MTITPHYIRVHVYRANILFSFISRALFQIVFRAIKQNKRFERIPRSMFSRKPRLYVSVAEKKNYNYR